jgi:AraC-like DNA-binding protein
MVPLIEVLGFCDEFYFSRRFREITGKSPSEFRAILSQGRV